jgi:hypothetical protein
VSEKVIVGKWSSMVMDKVDVSTLVDVEGSKLRGERLNFLRYTAIKTDSHEHMLSIYA